METILVDKICECKICGHIWIKRKESDPKLCPKCRSSKWDGEDLHKHYCIRCKKIWYSSLKKPVECYHCHSMLWDIPYKYLKRGEK